jgi:hypothetical protein
VRPPSTRPSTWMTCVRDGCCGVRRLRTQGPWRGICLCGTMVWTYLQLFICTSLHRAPTPIVVMPPLKSQRPLPTPAVAMLHSHSPALASNAGLCHAASESPAFASRLPQMAQARRTATTPPPCAVLPRVHAIMSMYPCAILTAFHSVALTAASRVLTSVAAPCCCTLLLHVACSLFACR